MARVELLHVGDSDQQLKTLCALRLYMAFVLVPHKLVWIKAQPTAYTERLKDSQFLHSLAKKANHHSLQELRLY